MEKIKMKMVFNKLFSKAKIEDFLKRYWLLILILIIGAFLRLYRIDEYMTFLGDEGRDAIVVRNLLTKADPILIGPGTSVGSMYLGPLYYYFMAPFLLLSNFSPVGPAIGIALLGVVTIYFVYIVGKVWFSKEVGYIAASLYALAPTVIVYSRSSWNPNIMPFFALLAVYSIWKVYKEEKYKYLILCAISFAFVLQSHYLGILLAPLLLIVWFFAKVPVKYTIYSLVVFAFLMSPLVFFDLRHDFLNSKALYKFLTVRQETVSARPWTAIPKSYPIWQQINTSMLTAGNLLVGKIATFVMLLGIIFLAVKKKITVKPINSLALVVGWLMLALIGFGIYKQHIYDHYFGFLFPVPFLIMAEVLQKMYEGKLKYLAVIFFVILIGVNIYKTPVLSSPNRQLTRSQAVAQKIETEAKGERFNIAVIAERNYEDGYQYFLEKDNAPIIEIDAQIPETVTNQLFVICEVNGSTLTEKTCDPTHSSKAEVANFGWSKIDRSWEVGGVILYKLIHSK